MIDQEPPVTKQDTKEIESPALAALPKGIRQKMEALNLTREEQEDLIELADILIDAFYTWKKQSPIAESQTHVKSKRKAA